MSTKDVQNLLEDCKTKILSQINKASKPNGLAKLFGAKEIDTSVLSKAQSEISKAINKLNDGTQANKSSDSKLSAKLTEKEQELKDLKQKNIDLESELKDKDKKVAKLETASAENKAPATIALRDEMPASQLAADNSEEVSKLNADIAEKNEYINQLEKEKASLEIRLADESAFIEKLKAEAKAKQTDYKQVVEVALELQNRLNRFKTEVTAS
jgi:predicted  nucleic acid-binding Zn-ribbon protein